jgi:hypothetical protein
VPVEKVVDVLFQMAKHCERANDYAALLSTIAAERYEWETQAMPEQSHEAKAVSEVWYFLRGNTGTYDKERNTEVTNKIESCCWVYCVC